MVSSVLVLAGKTFIKMLNLFASSCLGLIPLIHINWDAIQLLQLWQPFKHLRQQRYHYLGVEQPEWTYILLAWAVKSFPVILVVTWLCLADRSPAWC